MSSLLSSAGLKNGSQLGNSRASSLIKSAQTLSNEIATYNDTLQKIQFENNPSDTQLQQYTDYLGKRVSVLQSTGSVTNATKALSMQQEIHSAISKNTSFNIQNESIQILSGTGSDQQKLNYIQSAFGRAMSIGDVTLAQSLESQGYTLSQKMQYDQQQAVSSAKTLSTANSTAMKNGFTDAIDAVKSHVTDIFQVLKTNGDAALPGALKNFAQGIGSVYKQVTGTDLPKNATTSLGSAVQAYFNMEAAYNVQAAHALQNEDPAAAAKFAQFDGSGNLVGGTAHDILTGKATVSLPGVGAMSLQQANQWALSDASGSPLYRTVTNADGTNSLKQNAITGYKMVDGQSIPVSNGNAGTAFGALQANNPNGAKSILNTLQGLKVNVVSKSGELTVQLTNEAIKNLHLGNSDLKAGDQVNLIPQSNGGLQFTKNGKIFSLALDSRNLVGVGMTDSTGKNSFIGGQYGFNQKMNTMINNATVQQLQAKAQQQMQAATTAQASENMGNGSSFSIGNAVHNLANAFGLFSNPAAAAKMGMSQRAGGGFNFTENGQAVSAAKYAQLTGTPFRTLLSQMASKGDSGAQTALGFVGNDYKFDPTKISSYQNAGTYNALTWGAGVPTDSGAAPTSAIRGMANGNVKF